MFCSLHQNQPSRQIFKLFCDAQNVSLPPLDELSAYFFAQRKSYDQPTHVITYHS